MTQAVIRTMTQAVIRAMIQAVIRALTQAVIRALTQAVIRRPLTSGAPVSSQATPCRVEKGATEKILLRVLWFSPVTLIPSVLQTHSLTITDAVSSLTPRLKIGFTNSLYSRSI